MWNGLNPDGLWCATGLTLSTTRPWTTWPTSWRTEERAWRRRHCWQKRLTSSKCGLLCFFLFLAHWAADSGHTVKLPDMFVKASDCLVSDEWSWPVTMALNCRSWDHIYWYKCLRMSIWNINCVEEGDVWHALQNSVYALQFVQHHFFPVLFNRKRWVLFFLWIVLEPLTRAACRTDWKRISAESSLLSPQGLSWSRDWTEVFYLWFLTN